MAKKLVGQNAPRRDAEASPVIDLWQTDVITNREPGFTYQFFRNDEVSEKLRQSRLAIVDHETGQTSVHNIPGWQICQRETGEEEAAGWRPDEGKPIDTVLRHGPYVAMKIPTEAWELLQRKQEQRADGYEERLKGGSIQDITSSGRAVAPRPFPHVQPGDIRLNEKFTRETGA